MASSHRARKTSSKIIASVSTLLTRFSVLVNVISSLLIIAICVLAFSSCVAYIQLANQEPNSLFFFKILNSIGMISITPTTEFISANLDEIKSTLEFYINISVAVMGMILSIFTTISYLTKKADIKRKSSFKKIEVFEGSNDDINTMLSYFKDADYIVIFSSTYSWVVRNSEMEKLLKSAAASKKLILYTSNKEVVVNNLKGKTELLNCIKETSVGLRLSYIERDNAKYLLYRQEEQSHTYIIAVHENIESMYLLGIVSQLVSHHE